MVPELAALRDPAVVRGAGMVPVTGLGMGLLVRLVLLVPEGRLARGMRLTIRGMRLTMGMALAPIMGTGVPVLATGMVPDTAPALG